MIKDEQLDAFRLSGSKIRVIRDADRENDIRGWIVAWNDTHVMIRKSNRNVVRVSREYIFQPANQARDVNPSD